MKRKQIIFTEINKAELVENEYKEPAPHEVVVETAVSTISCGTERANLTGDPNVCCGRSYEVIFPRIPGYSSAGTIVAVGSAVKNVKVGDRVAAYYANHASYVTLSASCVEKLPDDVSFETAAMSFISTFPMAAVRKTRVEMGESAIVMGQGILGLIAVKLLRVAGAVPIIAADPNPARREIALKNGADYALDPLAEGFADEVKRLTNGGANVAIEVTGVGAGLDEALDCMAKFGRVALLGCTRNSDFTIDYYKKVHAPGITLIGAHTGARPDRESHGGWFTHNDDIKALLKLCHGGRLTLDNLVEETHSPTECGDVYYRLATDKKFPIVVQYDWRLLK